ncbi:hypothetical protein [Micromonospora arborensis]|uniref:hypothetical protein n=1 Tax=Micromonospora arborensis TaxID=2116518 RepID=UPI00371E1BB9
MIDLVGGLDQSSLDRLRAALGLSRVGRLGDDWDELFGEAIRTVAETSARLELWRDVDTGQWRLDVEGISEPPDPAVQSLLTVIRGEIVAAEVQVASVRRRR